MSSAAHSSAASGSSPSALARWEDKHAGRLAVGEKTHDLAPAAAAIMECLLERPDAIVRQDRLIEAMQEATGRDEANNPVMCLRVQISRLRKLTGLKIPFLGRGYAEGGYSLRDPAPRWQVDSIYQAKSGATGPLKLVKVYTEPVCRFLSLEDGTFKYLPMSALESFGFAPVERAGR